MESLKGNHRFGTEEITIDPGPPRYFAPKNIKTFVVTLGTSTPSPNPYRFGAAGAIIANEKPYLIDCGEGIIRGIAKAASSHNRRFVDCFAPNKLTNLFLTHLHSDHIVGLPSLILNPWIFGKTEPLNIYGPVGTKNLVEKILDGYMPDIIERGNDIENASDTGWQVNVQEFEEEGLIFEDENIKFEAFSHAHGTLQNFGFRISTNDRIVVWAGDGKVSKQFQEMSSDADILVSEICSEENIGNSPWGGMSLEEKERIIWSYHIKPKELADLAIAANVKKLVLIHESNYSKPYDPEALLKEIKTYYNSIVYSSRDGDVF